MFASANVAVDQNHLAMDTIKKVANRHQLTALLHEKPFQGTMVLVNTATGLF